MSEETSVKVRWYCGHYVGKSRWSYSLDWTYEPDECATEFVTGEDEDEWLDSECSVECPRCGAVLSQLFDHAQLDEGSNDR